MANVTEVACLKNLESFVSIDVVDRKGPTKPQALNKFGSLSTLDTSLLWSRFLSAWCLSKIPLYSFYPWQASERLPALVSKGLEMEQLNIIFR